MKVSIDPEFSGLLPERDITELEDQILADGAIREPVVVWKDGKQCLLLDGHRRQRVKDRNPALPMPKPVVLEFETRDEAHDWVIHNQRARRNLTPEEDRYLLGKLYLKHKPGRGKPKSGTVPDLKTAENIGKEAGVDESTVRRAGRFAEAVDAAPEIKEAVVTGKAKATATDLKSFSALPPKAKERAAENIKNGVPVKRAVAAAKPKRGQPTKDARKFSDLESQIGKCVRANTAIKEQFGGAKYHEQIRQHLNECLKALAAWKKEARPA